MNKGRSRKQTLRLMALGILAVCAVFWGSVNEAQATLYQVSGSVTPTSALTNVYIALEYKDSSNANAFNAYSIGSSMPANTTTGFYITPNLAGSAPFAYTIVGLYDWTNNGVTVGSNSISGGTAVV